MFLIFQMELGTGLLNLTPPSTHNVLALKNKKKNYNFLIKNIKKDLSKNT